MPAEPLTQTQLDRARSAIADGSSQRAEARRLGVSRGKLARALARIPDRVRRAEDFAAALAHAVRPPIRRQGPYTWDLEAIRSSRDAQMRGDFGPAARLAEAMRTDDALYVAYHNRIAPQAAIAAELIARGGTRGEAVARKAPSSVFAPRSVLQSITGTLADHGVAFGYVEHEPRDDGTMIDMRLTEWPIEFVRWNNSEEHFETQVRNDIAQPITHGDGRWVVLRKFHEKPWTREAAVLPGALIWAAHANGIKDWASSSASHGLAKIIGELPAGVTLTDADGLTPEATAFLQMLQDIVSGEAGAGIRPAGAKTDFLANGSTAWQVFKELILNREKAAARIYLGTDAILGSVGGAPGVDIAALFGVATTKIQGDFEAIEQALDTGLYQPWTAINFGDSRYAPRLRYQMPDVDAKARSEERAAARDRLLATIERMQAIRLRVTQADIDALAAEYGVDPAPVLAAA